MRFPVPHWPSVAGRARADAGPLLLTAVVVAIVAALTAAVPVLLRSTADDAVRDAVRRAGTAADVTVTARWEPDDGEIGRKRFPRLAEDVTALRDRALDELGGDLRRVLLPPVAGALSPSLKVTDGSVLRTLRLGYLSTAGGPAVTWTAGGAPGATVEGSVDVPPAGPPWQVSIGLSETAADVLGFRPGDRIPAADENGNDKNVVVSGIFRPTDPADPAWRQAPWLLEPAPGADGFGTTRFGGLLSDASLPDARLAFAPDAMPRTVWFSPDPDVLTWDTAERITATAVSLKATSASSSTFDTTSSWNTQLDAVLRDVREQIAAASAQAAVLLIAVLTVAVLVLLLAAELLVRRRAATLTVARQRGAGLPALAGELLLESLTVTLVAAAAGVALARTVVASAPGASPGWAGGGLGWTAPVVLTGIAAAPVLGVLAAARATRDRRVPANRSARTRLRRTAQLRRLAAEGAVVLVAAGAFTALHQRGVEPGAAVALPAAAPTLGLLAGALLLLRLLPLGTGLVLRRALRSRRPLAVFGAARAAESGGRALPLLTVVAAAGLSVFAGTVAATVETGLRDGAWRSTGADVRLDLAESAGASAAEATAAIAGQPGVRHAVAGRVVDAARIVTEEVTVAPRLVVVDVAAFRALLADTPLPDAPALAALPGSSPAPPGSSPAPLGTGSTAETGQTAGSGPTSQAGPTAGTEPARGRPEAVPVLVLSGDGSLRPGMSLRLLRDEGAAVPLTAVGTAPAIGGAPDVVLVDASALAAAGAPAEPNTIWATGPGAARAAANSGIGADVVPRTGVLRERRDAPLVTGLRVLAWASAAVMLALGLAGFALSAAASAPERWQTLTRLRTIGLRPRDTRTVAAAELLPLAAVAAVAGPALGVLLAGVTLGPLALRLLTGQSADPLPALPWLTAAGVAGVFLLSTLVVAPLESAVRRRQRLSEVLRVGTP
ncbi:FtsX-like permease family protein [Actinoplanes sp. DH11]|uniref:FtsX-like permease family protein n=1 Tax=Actinoplanes sp. DH11 TaxID=2857011 RepID=UPI001E4806A9|nr:FtsX-like permease family protein [Actinoplanes sp. DH11]